MNAILSSKWSKVFVFLLCLVPFGLLFHRFYLAQWGGQLDALTANPQQFIEHYTGDWVLLFLVFTLCITPLRKIPGLSALIRYRRMLGLYAFFYVCLHFTTWLALDRYFDWSQMVDDISKRPYITVGFTAFVLLIPLAITSTAGWIRRLGGKRWNRLHKLIYVSAVLGVIHYYWLVKSDVRKPVAYGIVIGLLLAWRLVFWLKNKKPPQKAPVRAASPSTPA